MEREENGLKGNGRQSIFLNLGRSPQCPSRPRKHPSKPQNSLLKGCRTSVRFDLPNSYDKIGWHKKRTDNVVLLTFPPHSSRPSPSAIAQFPLFNRNPLTFTSAMSSRTGSPSQPTTIVAAKDWTPTSWQSKPIKQDVDYPDQAHLAKVLEKIGRLPPMVAPGEVKHKYHDHFHQIYAALCLGLGLALAFPAPLRYIHCRSLFFFQWSHTCRL